MSDMIVFAFDNETDAFEMRDELISMQKQKLVELEDAAVVVRHQDGKVKVKQVNSLAGAGALGGAFWGLLFGLIFFVPFLGMAVGAAMGALAGHFSNYGINEDFIEAAREKVTAGTSALFMMTGEAVQDKVRDAIVDSGLEFEIFYSNLSKDQEAQLRADFGA